MKDITIAQLAQVITTVVRSELAEFEVRLWERLNTELDHRFAEQEAILNEILNAIGEENEKLTAAIGGHTVELADHGGRIKRLETLAA